MQQTADASTTDDDDSEDDEDEDDDGFIGFAIDDTYHKPINKPKIVDVNERYDGFNSFDGELANRNVLIGCVGCGLWQKVNTWHRALSSEL